MLIAVSIGLLASLLMGALFVPTRGRFSPTSGGMRALSLYCVLSGLAWWLSLFSVACLLSQRLYFAITLVVVLHGVLIAVNYTKFTALKEPFILQDFEYFTDALRHPQLYIPFFGVIKTCLLLTAGAAAIGLFFWLEAPLYRQANAGWQGPIVILAVAFVAAMSAWIIRPRLSLDPLKDVQATGLIALLHSHLAEYWLSRKRTFAEPAAQWPQFDPGNPRPHLVMVQSESFFDPRPCYPFIKPSVLKNWDECCTVAAASGQLSVPAWGANTVRTEAAILTGLSQAMLGIYQYNPYRRLAKRPVHSLASHLRAQGYKTICVHPYPAQFYLRDRVMPALGFDQFIDISEFDHGDRSGQYVGDQAVADKVTALLAAAEEPVFIFVITMENHGPLHLEKPDPELETDAYRAPPAGPLQDLTAYLRHLKNADQMLAQITSAVQATDRGGSLCWYGDHVPIMSDVYRHFGEPEATTPWLIWSTGTEQKARVLERTNVPPLRAESLSEHWLQTVKECHRV